LILFKMKIITISGTCKRNPIWVPKKDLWICKMNLAGEKMQPREYFNQLGRFFFSFNLWTTQDISIKKIEKKYFELSISFSK
jgi:hypothetical protein